MQKNYLKILGDNIRMKRKEKDISQEQLSNIADIDRSYCGSIERAERNT